MNIKKKISKIMFYLLFLVDRKVTKAKIDQIINDEIKCLTDEEIYIKRLSNALNYVFNNVNQIFNEENLNVVYYLLTNSLLDKEISNKIVMTYYENIDNSAYYLTTLIHTLIIDNTSNVEFAFIVSEFIMLKKKKTLLVPRDFVHNDYKNAILSKDFSLFVKLMLEMEYICENKNPCKYTKKEIIEKIKLHKKYLVDTFHIRKLYLFGSFAKGTNNENSDIDFLVILDESLINIERLNQIELIKEYLSELFECSLDVLDFTFALKELGENEIEHALTLI